MQDMTPEACMEGNIDGKTLIDIRDGKPYTVARLNDGKCWMTQNLALIDKTIDSTDSDIKSGSFTVPTSDISGFSSGDQNQSKAYYQAAYGGYYNWYTATAGTGNGSITANGANVSSSICPKGWRLPTGGNSATSELYYLANGLTPTQIIAKPYYFVKSGYLGSSSLANGGRYGYLWSSTSDSESNAYLISFTTSVNISDTTNRFSGISVRCVAR